jgi:cyanophycinase
MPHTSTLHGRLIAALFVITLVGVTSRADQPKAAIERLRPNGIDGTVMLVGDGDVPNNVKNRFLDYAGGEKAVLVIVLPKSADEATIKSVTDEWEARKPASVSVVKADDARLSQALHAATGVWLVAGGASDEDLRDVVKRAGAVACVGKAALHHVAELLPDTNYALANKNAADEAKRLAGPGRPGIVVENGMAIAVRRRDIRVIGSGKVYAALAAGAGRPEKLIEWSAGSLADFNTLVRSAIARTEPPFPPKDPPVPEVPSGSLVIVGGGGMPADVSRKFIELAGGPDALIVVLPISMPDPIPASEAEFLTRNGVKHMEVIKARELADVDSPKNLELLRKAGGVWFGGGRQWHFVDSYAGTKFEQELHNVLKRGGVIGGSSAGATIQGDYLCRGDPFGPQAEICEGYERGLGFLPGVGIDQHFTQRKRQPDMTGFMKVYPQLLGIGLDEATAIVVKGHVAEVMGRGKAHFYDRRKPVEEGKPDYEAFAAGARYDLKNRKVMPSESTKPNTHDDHPKK